MSITDRLSTIIIASGTLVISVFAIISEIGEPHWLKVIGGFVIGCVSMYSYLSIVKVCKSFTKKEE